MDKGKIVEIERRFLLKNIPSFIPALQTKIDQWYKRETQHVYRWRRSIPFGADKPKLEKIIKLRISPGVNSEEHIPIGPDEFTAEIINAEKHICKIRTVYKYKDLKFEVDNFSGMRLVICEVELKDIAQPIYFPDYISDLLIKEITGETEFDNYNLAS